MPAAAVTSARAPKGGAPAPAGVPFMAATYDYSEPMFTQAVTPGASSQDFTFNITPGGFLRGITLSVTTTTAGAAAVAAADAPWNLFSAVSIETIDGTPLIYPLGGYALYLVSKYTRPWDGDPAGDPAFTNSATTLSFRLRAFIESRLGIGVMPNTDARAQYRLRFTVAPSNQIWTSVTTVPVLQVAGYVEAYAQPDRASAQGVPQVQIPDGLAFQRFLSHEIPAVAGGNQTLKSNRVGNLVRTAILVVRSSAGARVDLTADPIRWRKDNAQILVEYRDRRDYEMYRFYQSTLGGTQSNARPTGVYVYPRWHRPGERDGQPWLDSSQATYLQWEINGAPAGGTVEIITEDLAPTVPNPPAYLIGL